MSKSRCGYIVAAMAVILVGAFVPSLGGCSRVSENAAKAKDIPPREFTIEGMHCQGCADSITASLVAIPGVQSAKVSLQEKKAVVVAKESDVSAEKIVAAIAAAGYQGHPASAAKPTTP